MGDRHTSDRKTLLPGFIGCLGISLEPQLGLGVDLIAIRLHCGERLNGDILEGTGTARDELEHSWALGSSTGNQLRSSAELLCPLRRSC